MQIEYDYDFIVIGGGSGGLSASKRAAQLGKKVALLDYVKPSPAGTTWGLGGTCVNVGCIPKKMMHYASLMGEAKHDLTTCGWNVDENVTHNWEAMITNVNNHVRSLNFGYKSQLITENVTYINSLGSFVDCNTIKCVNRAGEESTITGKDILVAVGGRPVMQDAPGFREHSISSDDLFWLKKAPGKSLVIGAGYIAMECGGFLQSMGNQTTILVRSVPLRAFDQDMIKRCVTSMEDIGLKFVSGYDSSKKGGIKKLDNGKLEVSFFAEGVDNVEIFDSVFQAIGREADVKGLGLDAAGVKYNKWNKIVTDDINRTNVANVWAIGDVIEISPELTPVAIKEGQLQVERLYDGKTKKIDYDMIATTIFTPQEYAKVGYGELDAEAKFGADNIDVYHTTFKPLEWNFTNMTKSKRSDACYVKVIVVLNEDKKVVGMHYTGPNAGEVIQGYAVAVKAGLKWEDFTDTIGIHPTTAEEFVTLNVTKRENLEANKDGC